MRFKLPRDRTIASTCGLSIGFKKGVFQLVPPVMYAEVIAAGGVSEEELIEEEAPAPGTAPATKDEREAAMLKVFTAIALRNISTEFTAGGVPHVGVVGREVGWTVDAKERDAAWLKFKAKDD